MATTKRPPAKPRAPKAAHTIKRDGTRARLFVGDCREVLPTVPECKKGAVDLIFADPPFNWNRAYDRWDDAMPEAEYLEFTEAWLDRCIEALTPTGSLWVNIPDDWADVIVHHVKRKRKLALVNWCIWHYRFGQNTTQRFINSKVHALYFCKDPSKRTWNPEPVMELSDRRSTYFDPRTETKKDGAPPGKRVPLDVWYGKFWGRIQGNNKERRASHDNQLPEVYLERVIRACSNEGDLVLDPFNGSGTTGVVALDWGREYIGIEFSKEMAASAAERIGHGMIRRDALAGTSSAIFEPRKRRAPASAAADRARR